MEIKSIKEFIKGLDNISKTLFKDSNQRIYYRGEAEDYKENKLMPKVFRVDQDNGEKLYNEHKEYSRALRHRPEEFNPTMSKIDVLSKMQHFGIATRLLDYTTNPLYALFFCM